MEGRFLNRLASLAFLALFFQATVSFPTNPDEQCGKCDAGFYVFQQCKLGMETVCAPCDEGSFTDQHNLLLSCAPCSSCPDGDYTSTECSDTSDTVCTPCANLPESRKAEFTAVCPADADDGSSTKATIGMQGDDPVSNETSVVETATEPSKDEKPTTESNESPKTIMVDETAVETTTKVNVATEENKQTDLVTEGAKVVETVTEPTKADETTGSATEIKEHVTEGSSENKMPETNNTTEVSSTEANPTDMLVKANIGRALSADEVTTPTSANLATDSTSAVVESTTAAAVLNGQANETNPAEPEPVGMVDSNASKEPSLLSNLTKPSNESEKLVNDTVDLSSEVNMPANETSKAPVVVAKPANETSKPSNDTMKPFNETMKPSNETMKPSTEVIKPSNETSKPSNETQANNTVGVAPLADIPMNSPNETSSNDTVLAVLDIPDPALDTETRDLGANSTDGSDDGIVVESPATPEDLEAPTTEKIPTLDELEDQNNGEDGSGSDEHEMEPVGGHNNTTDDNHEGHIGAAHGDTDEDDDNKKRTAIIVGVSVGAVAIFALLFFTSRKCRKRGDHKTTKKAKEEGVEFKPLKHTPLPGFDDTDDGDRNTNGIYRQGPKMGPPSPRIHRKGEGKFEFPQLHSQAPSKSQNSLDVPNSSRTPVAESPLNEPFLSENDHFKYIDESTDDEYSGNVKDRLLKDPNLSQVMELSPPSSPAANLSRPEVEIRNQQS